MSDAPPIDTAHLADVLARVQATLREHRTEVDELNVFPVPDGDTGTNMAMTARAALDAAQGGGDEPVSVHAPDADRTRAVVRAAMRGARGNSGVILSQVLRSLVEAADERGPLDTDGYVAVLARSRELAYEAVADPVEGTMLTAIAVAAETATACRDRGEDLLATSLAVCVAVEAAVARTQDQLEALRVAGVVDAGARGFELVVQALHSYLADEPFDSAAPPAPHVARARGELAMREAGSLEFRFEVQYLLDAPDETVGELREALERFGDSVVVVAAGGLTTVHVHTNDVGGVIEEGLRFGRPSRIDVTYFADEQDVLDLPSPEQRETSSAGSARAKLGCVVVLPGPGLRELAEDMGAVVVEGASGQLPSVADLLNAIGDVRAERIAILPGHRNAVPTARQASDVSVAEGGRTLDVVETATTATRALAALAVYDPDGEAGLVLDDMTAAAAVVRSGEVVAAVRDADTPAGPVREGQHLGLCGGQVVAVSDDPLEALVLVAGACAQDECELVTLVVGADVPPDERADAEAAVRDVVGHADVEVVTGGQRPSRYLIGCE